MPAGVRVLPSLAWPTPAEPIRAVTGPSTAVQPSELRSQAVSCAVVDRADAATTVTTWPDAPGSTRGGGRSTQGGRRTTVQPCSRRSGLRRRRGPGPAPRRPSRRPRHGGGFGLGFGGRHGRRPATVPYPNGSSARSRLVGTLQGTGSWTDRPAGEIWAAATVEDGATTGDPRPSVPTVTPSSTTALRARPIRGRVLPATCVPPCSPRQGYRFCAPRKLTELRGTADVHGTAVAGWGERAERGQPMSSMTSSETS